MQTIFRPSEVRITVSEARRLILEASPQESWCDVFQPTAEDDQDLADVGLQMVEVVRSIYFVTLNRGLLKVLEELQIRPAMKYFLSQKDFSESSDPDAYVITHEEFVALARYCDVKVTVRETPAAEPALVQLPQSDVAKPPVRWTDDVIKEARDRAQKTSITAAATHYGVKRQRLAAILNKESKKQAKAKTPTVFAGLMRRG